MPVKFEQNRMQTTRNFEFCDKKTGFFYNQVWQRVDAILEDASVADIISNAKLKTIIFQCSKTYTTLRRLYQVKSCTKHGRPDQSQQELTVASEHFISLAL